MWFKLNSKIIFNSLTRILSDTNVLSKSFVVHLKKEKKEKEKSSFN